MTATLVLVRHGQSQWNLQNKFTGWVDVSLTVRGEKEAETAGEMLKGTSFDLAFTSGLQRAQKTLELMLHEMDQNPPVTKSEKLNERNYGDLQGKNKKETAEIHGEEQVHIWRRSFDVAPPNGESLKDTADRVIPYFQAEIEPFLKQNKSILVVAHGNSLRALIMYLEKMTGEEIVKFEIATGVPYMYLLDYQNGCPTIIEKKILEP